MKRQAEQTAEQVNATGCCSTFCWHDTQSVLVVVVVPVMAVAPVVAVVTPAEREAPPATPDPAPPDTLNTI